MQQGVQTDATCVHQFTRGFTNPGAKIHHEFDFISVTYNILMALKFHKNS